MTQEEIHESAAQDALLMRPKLKGYTGEQQLMHKNAFVRGYEAAQEKMFSEEEIREACKQINLMVDDRENLIDQLIENKKK